MIKILNLVLYSDDIDYNEMYKILNDFYKHYEDYDNKHFFVKTYYYKFNNTIDNDIELIDNIINIKGDETFIPGILDKTLIAFKYIEKEFNENNYDYLIRSNISSILDFNLFSETLKQNPIHFGSTSIGFLNCIDKQSGIIDDKYFNLYFAGGTNIIMSKYAYKNLLNNINLFDKTIIDDVAISIVFNQLNIKCELLIENKHIYMINELHNIDDLNNIDEIIMKKYLVYRNNNKKKDRSIDIQGMKKITSKLLSI